VTIDETVAGEYADSTSVSIYATHADWCYDFIFTTNSAPTLTQHRSEIDAILASFRFNR
jgi:hypothetical protein